MAQIFISHSKKDVELINFFTRIFSGTKVKAVFMEFEKIMNHEVSAETIKLEIEQSNAVFLLLGDNVQNLSHTRDWVVWESGVSTNREIWVFEQYNPYFPIQIVIPRLNHYAPIEINDEFFRYIRTIVESYDDSNFLPIVASTTTLGAGIGALGASSNQSNTSEGSALGALIGGIGGLLLNSLLSVKRPSGVQARCIKCSSIYNIHIPPNTKFRCPVCNQILIQQTNN